MEKCKTNKLLVTGVAGMLITALCCFTQVLVILLGAIGLSAAVGYLDFVLLPVLLIFAGMTVYALARGKPACCESADV